MFEFIDKVIYINLEDQIDRKNHIETELNKYFTADKIVRFNAIFHDQRAIGCAMSKIAILKMAQENKWKNILVVEDDAIWNNFDIGYPILEKVIKNSFDMILLGTTYAVVDSNFRLMNGQTATAYIANNHYYETLISNFTVAMNELLDGKPYTTYAIDQWWKKLQKTDTWYAIVPSLMVESSSNIEKNLNSVRCFI